MSENVKKPLETASEMRELSDNELEVVVGGYTAGDTIHIQRGRVEYCPTCGKLVMNCYATVTGVRGERNGVTYYWISYNCCGHRTSVGDDVIVS